jgi:antitoxin (DNA-binding transcriptional repressor) of toxin-antitoxin stability system
VNQPALTITSATQKVDPALATFLAELKSGEKIKITQRVRVGARIWPATTGGVFRHVDYLATGLSTERVPEDDIVVPVVHFTKDNGELSSVALDEYTKIERS